MGGRTYSGFQILVHGDGSLIPGPKLRNRMYQARVSSSHIEFSHSSSTWYRPLC